MNRSVFLLVLGVVVVVVAIFLNIYLERTPKEEIGISRESKAFSVAIWANPLEPPPESTSPIFGEFSTQIHVDIKRKKIKIFLYPYIY